jgi:excisionase family DNA binding protein
MDCKFYSVSKAKELLNVSRLTVYRKIAEKEIPAIRLGRKILIPASFLQELEDKSRVPKQPTEAQ